MMTTESGASIFKLKICFLASEEKKIELKETDKGKKHEIEPPSLKKHISLSYNVIDMV